MTCRPLSDPGGGLGVMTHGVGKPPGQEAPPPDFGFGSTSLEGAGARAIRAVVSSPAWGDSVGWAGEGLHLSFWLAPARRKRQRPSFPPTFVLRTASVASIPVAPSGATTKPSASPFARAGTRSFRAANRRSKAGTNAFVIESATRANRAHSTLGQRALALRPHFPNTSAHSQEDESMKLFIGLLVVLIGVMNVSVSGQKTKPCADALPLVSTIRIP